MKKIISFAIALSLIVSLAGCGKTSDNAASGTDGIIGKTNVEDPNVTAVKNGSLSAYPNKTYGAAFESFFTSPEWIYFKGSKAGSDEGEYDIVEFTGGCTYQDVPVKAKIQFTLNKDNNTFEATYLSFNDVPQSTIILAALLDKAFTGDTGSSAVPQQADTQSQPTASDKQYISVSADEMFNTLKTNALKASNTYKGKYVQVSGFLSNVDSSGSYISLGNGNSWSFDSILCSIKNDSQLKIVENLSVGQAITVKGLVKDVGEVLGYSMDIEDILTQTAPESSGGDYLFNSDSEYITTTYLDTLTQQQVRFILNEIYARNGYIFSNETYKNYFSAKSWYNPVYTSAADAEALFNSVEKANKETITKYESSKGWR